MKTKKKTQQKHWVINKKSGKQKTNKKERTALQTPKIHNTKDNTVVTHGNYTPKQPYSLEVQKVTIIGADTGTVAGDARSRR